MDNAWLMKAGARGCVARKRWRTESSRPLLLHHQQRALGPPVIHHAVPKDPSANPDSTSSAVAVVLCRPKCRSCEFSAPAACRDMSATTKIASSEHAQRKRMVHHSSSAQRCQANPLRQSLPVTDSTPRAAGAKPTPCATSMLVQWSCGSGYFCSWPRHSRRPWRAHCWPRLTRTCSERVAAAAVGRPRAVRQRVSDARGVRSSVRSMRLWPDRQKAPRTEAPNPFLNACTSQSRAVA